MLSLLLLTGLAMQAWTAPVPHYQLDRATNAVRLAPQVVSATYLANVTDPGLTRDSCGSTRIGNRLLWTCRDTQIFDVAADRPQTLPIVSNSAAWTNLTDTGGPLLRPGPVGAGSNGSNPILQMYGGNATSLPTHFPLQQGQCLDSGACEDGSRWVVWMDQPPLVTQLDESGSAIAYTWIPNQRILSDFTTLDPEPSYTLFRSTYMTNPDLNAVPRVQIVSGQFYNEGDVGFGRYGSVIRDGYAYLYGQISSKGTALARVPIASIESRESYTYYQTTTNTWVSTPPPFNDTTAAAANSSASSYIIPNAGLGGQGTFYYSSHFSSYIWIGQSASLDGASANFYLSVSPAPEGPWTEPYALFQGQNGDHETGIGGYTLQAHPALGEEREGSKGKGVYVTWTQQWRAETVGSGYVTPLVWLEWE